MSAVDHELRKRGIEVTIRERWVGRSWVTVHDRNMNGERWKESDTVLFKRGERVDNRKQEWERS